MRISKLLLVCFIILILVLPSYQNINDTKYGLKNDTSSLSENNGNISYSKNSLETLYTPHFPIYITSNDDFTRENGVMAGNGTKENPYIIEGWEIKGNLFWKMVNRALYYLERSKLDARLVFFVNIPVCGIYLMDTTKHVTIRDNYIHDWSGGRNTREITRTAGITIINASNVTMEHNMFESNSIGVNMDNWNMVKKVHGNSTVTVFTHYNCTNISIKFNDFIANGYTALSIRNAYNSSITYNNISKSSTGILCSSSSIYIANNNIFSNSNGIICDQSDNSSVIESNTIVHNSKGIYCAESVPGDYIGSNPTIANNIISENAAGIFICKNYPTISNNTITHNDYGIMNMGASEYATVIIDNIISNSNFGISYWGYAIIEHNLISSNIDGVGIVGNATVRYNIVSSNTLSGIACAASEIGGKICAPVIHYNNIFDNGRDGVHHGETVWNITINATYNYWGSPDGPSGYGNGSGDSVDKNIIFEPWLVKPYPKAGPR